MPRINLALVCACLLFKLTSAHADCFDDAASYHRVNPTILRAIAIVESGGKPAAINRNANGSVDFGEMQINSAHLPELARFGMSETDLFDACKSIYTGAWILRKEMDKYGNTWAAVGAYHSATPYLRDTYAEKVKGIAEQLAKYGE
jgi:lysozyme-related protein Hpa2